MAKATWSVTIEPNQKLLRLAITGSFSGADVLAFRQDVAGAIAKLLSYLHGDDHVSICDARGAQIQAKEATAAFSGMLSHPAARSRKLAYVVDSALAQMQIRRLTGRSDVRFFHTVEDAEAWIFE